MHFRCFNIDLSKIFYSLDWCLTFNLNYENYAKKEVSLSSDFRPSVPTFYATVLPPNPNLSFEIWFCFLVKNTKNKSKMMREVPSETLN